MVIRLEDGTLTAVPVTIDGIPVGSARVHTDGTIDLVMGTPSSIGQEILKDLQNGQIQGLSIGVVESEEVPSNVGSSKEYREWISSVDV